MPSVGDTSRGAALSLALAWVTYPFLVGAVSYTAGCYLIFVEVINNNLQEEILLGALIEERLAETKLNGQAGTRALAKPRRLRLWGWQPYSLLYWAALIQLIGSIAWVGACACDLPGMYVTHSQHVARVYLPSLLGSFSYVYASYIFLAEVTHSYNCFEAPAQMSLGYVVASLNLLGSVLFLVASAFYFVQVPPFELGLRAGGLWGWEYQVSEWGVRFTFGVGSLCFVLGAMVSFPELLNE